MTDVNQRQSQNYRQRTWDRHIQKAAGLNMFMSTHSLLTLDNSVPAQHKNKL